MLAANVQALRRAAASTKRHGVLSASEQRGAKLPIETINRALHKRRKADCYRPLCARLKNIFGKVFLNLFIDRAGIPTYSISW